MITHKQLIYAGAALIFGAIVMGLGARPGVGIDISVFYWKAGSVLLGLGVGGYITED